ncbi:hypothetical protein P3T27_006552 [Kitasatospora sp. MAA19]|uniref:hypothetical protein n=1 Tax=Kitasatospora sp. MAA19 TaxID=3035090 RepID=UPI002474135D|nr:hypothetical protein [Kitasatospora sp. MAA19]MDH6709803.1 hypothetical protein [Kitasatospora sp. MAA19]
MTREQRERILGPAGLALVIEDGKTDRPPSVEQLVRLRAIFAGSVRKSSRSSTTLGRAAA